MIRKLLLTAVSLVAIASGAHAQQILTQFTFEGDGTIATAGPFNAEVGTGTAQSVHAGTSTYSSPAGNGSAHSFSSTNWAVGDYYQLTASTVGATAGIYVTVGELSSNTGPSSFTLQYSSTGTTGTFTALSTYAVTNDSWSSTSGKPMSEKTFDLSGIAALINNANDVFRLVDASTVAVTGGVVASTGTSRIDDFYVSAGAPVTPVFVPEPSTYAIALFGLVLLGSARLRRRLV